MQMAYNSAYYRDKGKVITVVERIIVALLTLLCFGGSMVHCDEEIPFCKGLLKELERAEKEWRSRCLTDEGQIHDSTCCEEEKTYLRERKCSYSKMCFYKGDNCTLN